MRIQQPDGQGTHGQQAHQDRGRQQERGLDLLLGDETRLVFVLRRSHPRIEVGAGRTEDHTGKATSDGEGRLIKTRIGQTSGEVVAVTTQDQDTDEIRGNGSEDSPELEGDAQMHELSDIRRGRLSRCGWT